ncbi:ABC transporter substrate-binding protein [Sphingopyxis alaskensis]|jgi:iron complex transport system substrate-binding protein|uniref:Periplasmic binding protein n=1 Tax=Sphingopyxis alaskensis (strain DSM 13593 / LMG 18877 / RB2256) TaxID=317655 RepID=Q1GUF2_SPHAL|nr:ABC transporter substrate-binding protein [Sphingopyxis alaskensis]ABF52720.1 periplasmic binding protein [Sphingopyxis alaskensis RB2256]MCM3418255.1 ABC transporter substrate-binding protein [Sphingopyxis alaskensis]
MAIRPALIGAALIGAAGVLAAAPADRGPPHQGDVPQRILSLNLCTDQLLLALADRRQIVGLTHNARDPGLSAVPTLARGLPQHHGSAEQLLAANPDLVVGMPARGSAALAALPDARYPLLDVVPANHLDDIYRAIRQTAAAVGHPERGDALIADMQGDLAALPRPGRGRVAAYYQRRGYMTGTGTLVDDLMTRAGLVNLAARLGRPPLAQVSLEEMVAADPDFLIVESATDAVTDQGSEMLHHPALDHIPRISVPQAWTVCGGPAYARAAQSIAAQIVRHDGGGA